MSSDSAADAVERHTPIEDAQGLIAGVMLVSLGVAMFKHAGLLTGGMAGAAPRCCASGGSTRCMPRCAVGC